MIKSISFSDGIPVMLLPLSFVVFVTMIKDWFEDYQRKKSDRLENQRYIESADEKVQW